MKITPCQRYNRQWILACDGRIVACSKETYPDEAAAMTDLPRVLVDLEKEKDKALDDIISLLENTDKEADEIGIRKVLLSRPKGEV